MIPLTRGIKRAVLGWFHLPEVSKGQFWDGTYNVNIPLAKGIQRAVLGWYVIISICWLWVPHVFSYRETTYIPDKALKTKAIFILKYFITFTLFTYLTQKPIAYISGWIIHLHGIAPSFTIIVIMISPQPIQGLDSTVFSDPDYQFMLKGSTTNCCIAPRPDTLANGVDYYISPASNGELLLDKSKSCARFHVKQVAHVTLPHSSPVSNNWLLVMLPNILTGLKLPIDKNC